MTMDAFVPRMIDADRVLARIPPAQMVDALHAAHRHAYATLARTHVVVPRAGRADGQMLVWLGRGPQGSTGAKFVSISSDAGHGGQRAERAGRVEGSPDTIHSAFVLCAPQDGRFRAFIVGNAFTRYKTAADSALGARFLARRDARTMTLVGAGAQAATHLRVMAAEFPTLREIEVWNRSRERAVRLVECARGAVSGATLRVADDLERSVRAADLVVCATSAEAPVLDGAWLRAGCHVDLVGAYQPQMREANDAAVLRARVYVDHRALVTAHCGDIRQPLDAGVIDAAHIVGDLFDLCSERVAGRQNDADITLFKNGGGAHLDLMFAEWLERLS